MKTNNIEIEVLINGRPARVFHCNGRAFIEARYESTYSIKITNGNYHRVMAVVSVDGISVLDGKPASKDGSGYVINAYDSATIKGYRKDADTVGAFKFAKKKKGYAKAVTGSSENSGVIAVAVFAEKAWTTTYTTTTYPSWTYNHPSWGPTRLNDFTITCNGAATCGSINLNSTATNAGVGSSTEYNTCLNSVNVSSAFLTQQNHVSNVQEAPSFDVSSTWGQKLDDKVATTTFDKLSITPMAEFSIYYDLRENLEKIGISFEQKKQVTYPKAFPNGFAEPPSGWVG